MCISIPRKILEINKNKIILGIGKEKIEIKKSIINIKKGDYVLVQNKIIIDKVPKEKVKEFFKILK